MRHTPIAIAVLSCSAPRVAACALRVSVTDELTRLIPGGRFDAPRGSMEGQGPWLLTETRARDVIARAAARSTDIPIDYEHQTLLSERNGLPAPAAGWVDPRSLVWRDDGLYGRVSWTAAAKRAISPGPDGEPPEYLYLSPVFPYDQGGEVIELLHLALTNTPAIDTAVTTLAAARMAATQTHHTEEKPMNEAQKLLALLGIEIAEGAAITAENLAAGEQAIAALKADAARAATTATELAALKSNPAKPDLSQYVPKAVYDEAQAQLAALKAGTHNAELDQLIEQGLADGRIPGKATADWLRPQGLAACKAYLDGAPAIAALKGGTQTNGKGHQGDDQPGELSKEELAVCKVMDLSPDEYRKANA
ncbi:hypothetical protein AN401_07225 [Zobellella denitrificans]|uniref:Protease (I) and scaffold (Z) protein n=1 Tax=Zobellella denitrificans TaxID=347534 RepID=A0A291HNF9_9GAMM|nr:phage protease [Zobellella denitrificans]ATG73674.1 hypothetical protein AN401_07225 [Zobellella denitrificans]